MKAGVRARALWQVGDVESRPAVGKWMIGGVDPVMGAVGRGSDHDHQPGVIAGVDEPVTWRLGHVEGYPPVADLLAVESPCVLVGTGSALAAPRER
jgi:hypothetical protein